jgi:hypothetical protein
LDPGLYFQEQDNGVHFLNIILEFLVRAIRQKKETERIQKGKEELKLPIFADVMILYLKDPKTSTKNLLDITNTFRTVAGYKINIQKSVAVLCTNNEQTKKEIRRTIPFTIF